MIIKIFFTFLFLSNFVSALAVTEDYHCEVRQYDVELTLTQDTSTSMWFKQNHQVLAMGYAGWVEKNGAKTVYHFYPGQFSPIEMTFKTQDTLDLPERLKG